ncbi:MAG: ATPase, T2SS/T4P/T4SS family [Burkholderiaceae bacterium]|nr:ATPase, T2SS/T4P/T4SS family [Burkholderiaceae bacterium]
MSHVIESGYSHRSLDGVFAALAPLRPFLEDPGVNEIQINAPNEVFVRRGGLDQRLDDLRLTAGMIRSAIHIVASINDKEVGERRSRFILSARLPGLRIEALLPPVATRGPSMCIRRHGMQLLSLADQVTRGVCSQPQADLLARIVHSRCNFLVSGGTYSGKTTLVNTLLALLPPQQRLFVIEQVHELKISSPNAVLFECDAEQGASARRAVEVAMRYSPHRVILGELRGPEALDFLNACNTGHPGSCSTIHADSAADALLRLEDLAAMDGRLPFAAVQARIERSIHWVIHMAMLQQGHRITDIARVSGFDRERSCYLLETSPEGTP